MDEAEFAGEARLPSLSDNTAEGSPIVVLAKQQYGLPAREPAPFRAGFDRLH